MGKSGLLSLVIAGLFSSVSGVMAEAAAAPMHQPAAKKKAQPSLICEAKAVEPGKTVWFGIHFEIEPKWHLYWNGRNDSGFPVEATITAPSGYKVGDLVWPAPKRHVAEGDIVDHIYEGSVTLMFPVEVPADAKGPAEFSAKLNWLVCDQACVAEDAEVKFSLPTEPPAANKKWFDEARFHWPKPMTAPGAPKVEWSGNKVTIQAKGAAGVAFFPQRDCAEIDDLTKSGVSKSDSLTLQLQPGKSVQPLLHGIIEITYPKASLTAPASPVSIAWFEVNQSAGQISKAPPTSPSTKPASK